MGGEGGGMLAVLVAGPFLLQTSREVFPGQEVSQGGHLLIEKIANEETMA